VSSRTRLDRRGSRPEGPMPASARTRAPRRIAALLREQLACVRPRLGGDLVAAQHACELLDPCAGGKSRQLGGDGVALADLADAVMLIRACGHLRQMSDT